MSVKLWDEWFARNAEAPARGQGFHGVAGSGYG